LVFLFQARLAKTQVFDNSVLLKEFQCPLALQLSFLI
jgi:hypothetical protein